MDLFVTAVTILSLLFLVSSCIEVGSNDATNLVNAVFGSGVMKRKSAIVVAGLFVVLGASFSSPVMDTVRKGIFDPEQLDLIMSISVFITAYFVSIMLLFVYSLFGMPVSTTATLVFCLAGGACGVLGGVSAVNWPKFFQVVSAILMSIFVSGVFSYIAQKTFRHYLGFNLEKSKGIRKHGSWIASLMMVSLIWFMLVKGMKHIDFINDFNKGLTPFGRISLMLFAWLSLTGFWKFVLGRTKPYVSQKLFHIVAILGMVSMAFAFGQNDLANCASPGVAIYMMWKEGLSGSMSMNVPVWALSACGFLMFLGMMTQRAKRVTMSEVKTGSQKGDVLLYAPEWCQNLAKVILSRKKKPRSSRKLRKIHHPSVESKTHYDALRASVILSVSACVIAFASGQGLPVSTTYVAFAAVVASGWGDGVFSEGQASLKIGRSIWVISGWFIGAAVAFVASFAVAAFIYNFKLTGVAISLVAFVALKIFTRKAGQSHADQYDDSRPLREAEAMS